MMLVDMQCQLFLLDVRAAEIVRQSRILAIEIKRFQGECPNFASDGHICHAATVLMRRQPRVTKRSDALRNGHANRF